MFSVYGMLFCAFNVCALCTMQSYKNAKQAESENNNLHILCLLFGSYFSVFFSFLLYTYIYLFFSFLSPSSLCSVHFVLVSSSLHIRHSLRADAAGFFFSSSFVAVTAIAWCCCYWCFSVAAVGCRLPFLLFLSIASIAAERRKCRYDISQSRHF